MARFGEIYSNSTIIDVRDCWGEYLIHSGIHDRIKLIKSCATTCIIYYTIRVFPISFNLQLTRNEVLVGIESMIVECLF